jgi:5'-nucleotidase
VKNHVKKFILITNDDGFQAEGIIAMRNAAASRWNTMIVAPDREQSARSHALTLDRPLRMKTIAEGVFVVDGTPTDCMMLALRGINSRTPDLAVSGINHGANLGTDVI